MTDLVDFLLARIAEDEAHADRCFYAPASRDGAALPLRARVLADCEAKRRVVEEFAKAGAEGRVPGSATAHATRASTLRLLSAAYDDHIDYLDEWRL